MIRLGSDAVILTSDEASRLLTIISIRNLRDMKRLPREELEFLEDFRLIVKSFYGEEEYE